MIYIKKRKNMHKQGTSVVRHCSIVRYEAGDVEHSTNGCAVMAVQAWQRQQCLRLALPLKPCGVEIEPVGAYPLTRLRQTITVTDQSSNQITLIQPS